MRKFFNNLKKCLIGVGVGANLCTILMLWACVACAYVSPDILPRLSIACLAFPVCVVINLLFGVVWLLTQPRLIVVPLIGILCVTPYLLDYSPIHLTHEKYTDSALCVVTFNAGCLKREDFDTLTAFIERLDPDIICFQEINGDWKWDEKVLEMTHRSGYERIFRGGREIYSRCPVLRDSISVPFPTRTNGCTACILDIHGDSVALFNCHLESNHLEIQEKDEYREMLKDPQEDKVRKSGQLLTDKLAKSASFRGQQTDTLCQWIDEHPRTSIILCGDFNDTPISYSCLQFGRRLQSAFREAGSGVGFSYNQSGFPVRIDHIYSSADWQAVRTYVDNTIDISDHYPLVTYLKANK